MSFYALHVITMHPNVAKTYSLRLARIPFSEDVSVFERYFPNALAALCMIPRLVTHNTVDEKLMLRNETHLLMRSVNNGINQPRFVAAHSF